MDRQGQRLTTLGAARLTEFSIGPASLRAGSAGVAGHTYVIGHAGRAARFVVNVGQVQILETPGTRAATLTR
jgi:hypothetical protein